ncbi:MAG: ribosome maturation factor RimP [Deltaproteobacteria bacterium]|nr:ribosome maturation factor RimP [Deltaproteobacteria bacterium]MBW1924233.1 ribosome maturation factor RimP [Deltaproteobacteria bacterium]MBW1949206.1 ribosome maturation factor RimP [Deltaproteobacteria bacterium]MBW2007181.1 ribosome maturation factor RimP [Deltaproteobacteria bacterium]MBW2346550.1 ribosome maturation factor RimP [Deltaproteobacteria bacterium]
MTQRRIAEQISSLADPVVDALGLELVDVEYLTQGGRWIVRVYVDREGGVTLDECAMLSRELGPLLDVKDVIPHEYVLEVSSPGLNRRLKKEKDFVWARGKKVKLRTRNPIDGRRNFTGMLTDVREGDLLLEVEGGTVVIALREIERANVVFEFGT